ncbi:Uncharacterised protein [Mycobacteroides abscessus subsp. abscessus]|nr:Uncharacterised protein [Mycobacteroides abscessus subsp. abscessus]
MYLNQTLKLQRMEGIMLKSWGTGSLMHCFNSMNPKHMI